ncbi:MULTISPECIES: hypothetical protein [Fischerella]|uniref:hypothetical protein n=2 Tax=Hapalosiphonaceae TaxID=1892263 RepID=UPI0012FBE1D9|nr:MULTISPECIES: hypothetical protein [Fischerella]MBD2434142.1 hypothetical protein [Fischerella sp. FACHB-380]
MGDSPAPTTDREWGLGENPLRKSRCLSASRLRDGNRLFGGLDSPPTTNNQQLPSLISCVLDCLLFNTVQGVLYAVAIAHAYILFLPAWIVILGVQSPCYSTDTD